MFTITINNEKINFDAPISLLELEQKQDNRFYAAKVNNRLRELNYIIDRSCNIEFLDLSTSEAVKMYEATLRYVFVMAIKRLKSDSDVKFNYGVSRGIFCEFSNFYQINLDVINGIKKEIRKIISENLKITRIQIKKDDIIPYYEKMGFHDKVEVLNYRDNKIVHLYECDSFLDYMYSYMLPSTGYLDKFEIISYNPGVLLQYPRSELNGEIPEFEIANKYSKTLSEERKWVSTIDAQYIARINNKVNTKQIAEFITCCEARHSNQLCDLANDIKKNKDIKLVAVSGPSSSGKTTFANKLKIELKIRGYEPVMISIDDYYLERDKTPRNESGDFDFEHIEALDLELFNNDMLLLLQGNEITLPHYDFKLKKRVIGDKLKLKENSIIIIEGIHALNERLTSLIPRSQKYKIFISPQLQLNTDNHNPIKISELRLIRRIVRDYHFRGVPPSETFGMWDNVRRGEFKWIYPFQEDADFIYNSELTYELCVLRKIAIDILDDVKIDSPDFIAANRLVKFLRYIVGIDEKYVPTNSLLREFIGGSIFYEEF